MTLAYEQEFVRIQDSASTCLCTSSLGLIQVRDRVFFLNVLQICVSAVHRLCFISLALFLTVRRAAYHCHQSRPIHLKCGKIPHTYSNNCAFQYFISIIQFIVQNLQFPQMYCSLMGLILNHWHADKTIIYLNCYMNLIV